MFFILKKNESGVIWRHWWRPCTSFEDVH